MANNNMTNDIVNDIAKISDRVDGLESNQSNAISVARINKVYPKLALRMQVRVFKQKALYISNFNELYPGNTLSMGGNTVLTRDQGV